MASQCRCWLGVMAEREGRRRAGKLSTMIMRPPQQGQGGRSSAAAAATSAMSCSADGSIDGENAAISSLA